MKKAVVLVMSCNEERFIEEEEIIRKTWGSPIINGEIENYNEFYTIILEKVEVFDNAE